MSVLFSSTTCLPTLVGSGGKKQFHYSMTEWECRGYVVVKGLENEC